MDYTKDIRFRAINHKGSKKRQDKLSPLLDTKVATNLIEKTNLTQDQKNACHLITTTKDQFVIIQGYAGTGKTTMFSYVQNMLKSAKETVEINEQDKKIAEENKEITEVSKEAMNHNKINKPSDTKNIEILALAPTHKAVKELLSIGIKAQTLKSFLIEQQTKNQNLNIEAPIDSNKALNNKLSNKLDKKLIILDEASMVPNNEFLQFLSIVGNTQKHVVLSGDIAQHISIGSGKPLEITQRSNVLKIVYLREIVRQKNPDLKAAVESVINKDYKTAFEKIENENPQNHIERIKPSLSNNTLNKDALGNQNNISLDFFNNLHKSIVEVDNNKLKEGEKTLEQLVADDFLSRTPQTRDQTVVIVHANHDRRVITDLIRTGLKDQGIIAKKGTEVNRLIPKGLTDTEHKFLGSYNIGDIVKLGKKHYHVIENDLSTKSLLLKDEVGKTKHFYPEKNADTCNIELYEHTKAELATGDIIRLTKTDKERELYANFEYMVKKASVKEIILESKDDSNKQQKNEHKEIMLNPKELKNAHWDYAQTVTGYGIQGGSKTYVIDFEVSYRKNLANQRSFYIGISRAIKHLIIYTDNKYRLLDRILGNKGDKYAALEVVDDRVINNNNHSYSNDNVGAKVTKSTEDKANHNFYDVKELGRLLSNSAESFVEKLLGRPNEKLSSASQWRYGNKGSLTINMSGDTKGLWRNFETGESGNLFTLIQKEIGLSFRESLKYVSDMFGKGLHTKLTKDKTSTLANQKNSSDKTHNKENNKEESRTAKYAKQLASESIPIAGTIVEKYLKETRGINNIDSPDIRYHPKVYTGKNEEQKYSPAMICLGRDKNGEVQCAQATYLDPKNASKADLDVKKRTYASPIGASVLLRGGNSSNKNQITFIAEGVETRLSVRDAVKNDVIVTLGKSNFTSIDPESVGQKVVFCLDNDGAQSFKDGVIHKAAERLIAHNKEVLISIPNQINHTKTDFNDAARIQGIGIARKSIDAAISYEQFSEKFKVEKNISNDIGNGFADKTKDVPKFTK